MHEFLTYVRSKSVARRLGCCYCYFHKINITCWIILDFQNTGFIHFLILNTLFSNCCKLQFIKIFYVIPVSMIFIRNHSKILYIKLAIFIFFAKMKSQKNLQRFSKRTSSPFLCCTTGSGSLHWAHNWEASF